MHSYTILKQLIMETGAELTSEDLHPEVFGSYAATYANHGHPIRLIWDGKDGWGYVQRQIPGGAWVDASDFLTEGDLEGVPKNHAKVEQFRQAVAVLLRISA